MPKVFRALATLLMLAVALQFFLAGAGAFDSAPKDESFEPHRALGYGILLFAVVLTLIAALARMPGRLIGMTGLVAGLVVVQALIGAIAGAVGESGGSTSTAGGLIFGLHAVNGLIIVAVVGTILRQARALSSRPAPVRRSAAAGESAGESAEESAEESAASRPAGPAHPAS